MSQTRSVCVICSKTMKEHHKNIFCKNCNGYVHKKCTKLKPKELKNLTDWICPNCTVTDTSLMSDISDDVNKLNDSPEFNVLDVDLIRYDNMIFNPIRFDLNSSNKNYSDVTEQINEVCHECVYRTPEQFSLESSATVNGKLNFLNVNVRSLSKNFEKLQECIKTSNCSFNVIGISETHLKDKPADYFNLPGYNIEYTNRIDRDKGGVCLYVSDKINYKLRNDLNHANSNYESCFIEVENKSNKNIVVGVIYRSHTSIDGFIKDIDPVFKKIISEKKIFYVMGDFNIDLLKVDSDRQTHDFLELIYSYSMVPTIYKPTRITETSATIIDNIYTNNENILKSTILVTDISDHLPTVLSTNLDFSAPVKLKKSQYKRKHTDANIDLFKEKLKAVKWNEVLDNNNANDDYDKFIDTFNRLYDDCIPQKKCTGKRKTDPKLPWITKGLLKSINKKNKLYKQYIKSPSERNLQLFKTYKNKLNTLIRKSKRKHFFTKFQNAKNNMRQTWKEINSIIGKGNTQQSQTKFKNECGNIFTQPEDISNQFNNFFVNIGPNLASNITNTGKNYFDYLKDTNTKSMYMRPIVEMEIIKIIEKFDPNKSAGNDNIGNFIIKKVCKEIVKPLTMILNLSISTGIVPEKLKIAKVVPIYKKK